MSQAEVPAVVEKIKEKLEFWKGDQDRKTKENIAAAQAEIDKLEAEATSADAKESARKPTTDKPQVSTQLRRALHWPRAAIIRHHADSTPGQRWCREGRSGRGH